MFNLILQIIVVHNKCNSHIFYQRFQSSYFGKKHNFTASETAMTSIPHPEKYTGSKAIHSFQK